MNVGKNAKADVDLIIQIDLPDLPDKPIFPHLTFAVQQVASKVYRQWLGYAQGEPLPTGKITPRSGAYLKSIALAQKNDLLWEVSANAPYAGAIEYGTAAYDMKQVLLTSAKVRRTSKGKRYLIIPFRHGTGTGSGQGISFGGNVMTQPEHALALSVLHDAPSRVTGVGQRPSGNFPGMMVPQIKYKWGGRLTKQHLQQAGLAPQRVQRLQGMVRFDHPQGGHSQYLTFRVMMEGSAGWQRTAQPGRFPMKTALDKYRGAADQIFQAAVQQDVAALLGG